MKIRLLVGHRKEAYPGQNAPEVFAVADEWMLEDDQGWWDKEMARQKDLVGSDMHRWAQVTLDVSQEDLMKALYPERTVTASRIVATEPTPGLGSEGFVSGIHDPRIGKGTRISVLDENEEPVYGKVVRLIPTGYWVFYSKPVLVDGIWTGGPTVSLEVAADDGTLQIVPFPFKRDSAESTPINRGPR